MDIFQEKHMWIPESHLEELLIPGYPDDFVI